MLPTYLPILIMMVVAAAMAAGLMLGSWLLGKVRGSRTDLMPYECGLDPMDEPFKRMSVRYYVVALLFLAILFIGYVYVWKKGALRWE